MRAQDYLKASLIDIIFEGRNKEYGAYSLRVGYEASLRKALISTTLLVFLLAFFYTKIVNAKNNHDDMIAHEIVFSDIEIPKEELKKPEPEKPKEAPKPPKRTSTYMVPKVVDNPIDEAPVTPPTDASIEVGTKNLPGSNDPTLPTTNSGNGIEIEKPFEPVEPKEPDEIITVVEQQAVFGEGLAALYKWLGSNINYPRPYQETGMEGKVVVRFVVEKDGSISNPQVVRSAAELFDKEAIRVIKAMPSWKPGKQNGRAVRSYFTLPIAFKLN